VNTISVRKQQSDDDPSGNNEQHGGKQQLFVCGNWTVSVRSAEWMIIAPSSQSLVGVAVSSGPRLQVIEWCNRLHEEVCRKCKVIILQDRTFPLTEINLIVTLWT
jgi:hypothetical protein